MKKRNTPNLVVCACSITTYSQKRSRNAIIIISLTANIEVVWEISIQQESDRQDNDELAANRTTWLFASGKTSVCLLELSQIRRGEGWDIL